MHNLPKVFLCLLFVITAVFFGEWLFGKIYKFPEKIEYGVSFSPTTAEYLNMDWRKTYLEILDDLKVKNIRIPTYWNVIQSKEDKDDFSSIDFMLLEAEKREVNIILVLGVRQPRWPECHIPLWARKLSAEKRQEKILKFIEKVVQRYKSNQSIKYWQVENEPLFSSFGAGCDKPDRDFLKSEVKLVRSLDTREVIVTDSGELGFWITAMKFSDIFGTTLYRTVYNPVIEYSNYPFLPYFYNLKSYFVKKFFAPNNKKTIIVELQAEPWFVNGEVLTAPNDKQIKIFPVNKFKDNVEYAKKTGFDTIFLWGVEWWYWIKNQGHPEYLEYARVLFSN